MVGVNGRGKCSNCMVEIHGRNACSKFRVEMHGALSECYGGSGMIKGEVRSKSWSKRAHQS